MRDAELGVERVYIYVLMIGLFTDAGVGCI